MSENIAPKNSPFKLTDAAQNRIKKLLDKAEDDIIGLQVSVEQKGCSGYAYAMDLVKKASEDDTHIVLDNGADVYITPKASMILFGGTMDYTESSLRSGFEFINPNEKGRCGCGESFHV